MTETTVDPQSQAADLAGFEAVCELSDLSIGRPAAALVGEHRVALVRLGDREVYAIDDICSHGSVSLSEGDVVGCHLECWLHGSRFDVRTGAPASPPATVAVPVYAVRLAGNTVYVNTTATPAEELSA